MPNDFYTHTCIVKKAWEKEGEKGYKRLSVPLTKTKREGEKRREKK